MEREHQTPASRARRVQETTTRPDRRRKTGRRPRRILGMWARVTLLAAFIGVLGLAIFGIVTKAIRPYREARTQKGQMSVTREQIAALDAQNADLRRRIAYLKTPEGKTTEARKMGFIKDGEIPIVVEGQAPPAPPSDFSAPASPVRPRAHSGSGARRLWRRLTGH